MTGEPPELETDDDRVKRLTAAVRPILTATFPGISESWSQKSAANCAVAAVRRFYDLPGGRDDRRALEKYLAAREALRDAYRAIPDMLRDDLWFIMANRVREVDEAQSSPTCEKSKAAFRELRATAPDQSSEWDSAVSQVLEVLPTYRPKGSNTVVAVVDRALAVWSWNQRGEQPSIKHVRFATYLQDLLYALEIKGNGDNGIASAASAYRSWQKFREARYSIHPYWDPGNNP